MNEINRSEKDSILYYQGGGENIILSAEKLNLREFYNVSNSYIVINALLMPGLSNERARLCEENRQVDLIIFSHMDELIEIYCCLYSAMCKYTFGCNHEASYYTYRDDRMNTLEFLNHGQMYSFMSTRKSYASETSFLDKDGILLLEVDASGHMEHVDVNAVLGEESIYPQEQEILFAPFALLDKESLEITEEEKKYKDINGKPPQAKYLLHLRLSSIIPCKAERNREELTELYAHVMDPNSLKEVRQIWKTLMDGKEPERDMTQRYVAWKEKLQMYLRLRFAGIKYEVQCQQQNTIEGSKVIDRQDVSSAQNNSGQQECRERLCKLVKDIKEYYNYTNDRREKYKKYVQRTGIAVAIIYPLATFFVALTFLNRFQTGMKIISLLLSMSGTIASMIAANLAWNEKLQQRTATYLKLDELMLDIKYERVFDETCLNNYVDRYKKIVQEDNEMGRKNADAMSKNLESTLKESEEK